MKKALIIDDEPEVAKILQLFLEYLNYTSDYYPSLDAVQSLEIGYDIVFCDYTLEGIDGIEVFKILQLKHPSLAKKFVLITGAVFDEPIDTFIKQEGICVVKKPYKIDEIKNVLLSMESL